MDSYILREISKESLRDIFDYQWNEENIYQLLNKDVLKELGLESAIIYCYDKIITDNVVDLEIEFENIMEARIFNETCELKVWRDDSIIKGSIFKEINSDKSPIEEEFILYPRNIRGYNPSKLVIKKYIDYDNDGQAYISYVKPSKLI